MPYRSTSLTSHGDKLDRWVDHQKATDEFLSSIMKSLDLFPMSIFA